MKIALIANRSLRDYVLDVFAAHPEMDAEIACLPVWKEADGSCYQGIPEIEFPGLSRANFDTVLIAMRSPSRVLDILPKIILSGMLGEQEKKIYMLRPVCLEEAADFIAEGSFDPDCVAALPASGRAFEIVAGLQHPIVRSRKAAKRVHTTKDGIEAYEIEDMYVKICEPAGGVLVGCTYVSDGTILDGCMSFQTWDYDSVRELFLTTDAGAVYDDGPICVLIRSHSEKNYWHFINQILDKILIAEELGFEGRYMLFYNQSAEQLVELLGIGAERIIWISREDIGKTYLIKEAFDVEAFSHHRYGFEDERRLAAAQNALFRLNAFADALTTKLENDGDAKDYPRRIYAKRIGRRRLLDIDEVLEKYSFFTMVPEKYTVEEQIKFFHYADIVICPIGAGMANSLFMREGSAFVETFPCNFVDMTGFRCVAMRKLVYRQIVEPCTANPVESTGYARDYRVNNMELDYTLQELAERYPL